MKTIFITFEGNESLETPLMADINFYIDLVLRFAFESFSCTQRIAPVNLSYL